MFTKELYKILNSKTFEKDIELLPFNKLMQIVDELVDGVEVEYFEVNDFIVDENTTDEDIDDFFNNI